MDESGVPCEARAVLMSVQSRPSSAAAAIKKPQERFCPARWKRQKKSFSKKSPVGVKKLKDHAKFYDNLYKNNKGVFYRGTAGGKGLGVGALGNGIYVAWDEGAAKAFAQISAMKSGMPEVIKRYRVAKGLNMLDAQSKTMVEIKKSMGITDPSQSYDDPVYSGTVTWKAQELGYDGVISDDRFDGLVIFDEKNLEEVR